MARVKKEYKCESCGVVTAVWSGQCSKCKSWNTIKEVVGGSASNTAGIKSSGKTTSSTPAMKIGEVTSDAFSHHSTKIGELDRVLGGGIVSGSVILIAGPPGVGKSSLLALVSKNVAEDRGDVLYLSGEESVQQIKIRHERMNAMSDSLYLASESDLSKALWHIEEVNPKMVIVDSLQTLASPDIEGSSGSVSQVKEVATVLHRIAKERGIPMIFVGHYTKDGNLAGPRVVEHLVDVVLSFEGEDDSPLRLLRGVKNRFGPSDEIGCFEHTENGLEEIADPSGLLIEQREESISGVATSIYLEGKRALPIQIEALVIESMLPNPRKITSGLDVSRSITLQAIMQKHIHSMRLADRDVHISTSGAMRIKDPAVELATVVALTSDALACPSPYDMVCVGEVSLPGNIRQVKGIARRLAEAYRLGFSKAMVPAGTRSNLPKSILENGMTIIEVKTVSDVAKYLSNFKIAVETGYSS